MTSTENTLELINSIIGAEMYADKHGKEKKLLPPPLVTVSRYYGAMGTDISKKLAERLQVQLWDHELLDAVVKEAKADKYLMEKLDEKATSLIDDFVHAFFSTKSASKDDFYHYMIKIILGISATGGVIVGRGAHLMLPKRQVFRLRIDGSLEVCAERIAERMDIKPAKAAKLILKTNKERIKFVKKIYERFPSAKSYYDMVISTDVFTQDQVVDLVCLAMKYAGFRVPESALPKL